MIIEELAGARHGAVAHGKPEQLVIGPKRSAQDSGKLVIWPSYASDHKQRRWALNFGGGVSPYTKQLLDLCHMEDQAR